MPMRAACGVPARTLSDRPQALQCRHKAGTPLLQEGRRVVVARPQSKPDGSTDRPDVHRDGDDFALLWEEAGVGMLFENVRNDRGGMQAELTVTHRGDVLSPARNNGLPLFWGNVLLTSTSSRNSVASTVAKRLEMRNWSQLIDDGCYIVAKEYRDGQPSVKLRDVPQRIGARHLIEKVLPLAETTTIFADGGSLKSLLALSSGISVATMWPMPAGLEPTQLENVLFLDWETTADEQAERTRLVCAGLGIDMPDNLHYRPMHAPLSEQAGRLRAEISHLDVGLVIVDSLAPACGGEPETAEVITRFYNSLRSLSTPDRPVTRLVVAHVSKAGAEQKNGRARVFGSVFAENLSRSVWEIRLGGESSEDVVSIGLFHRKVNGGRLQKPIGLRARFEAGKTVWEAHKVTGDGELAAFMTLPQRIRDALKRHELSLPDLAVAVDAKEDSVYKALRRMPDVIQRNPGRRGSASVWGMKHVA